MSGASAGGESGGPPGFRAESADWRAPEDARRHSAADSVAFELVRVGGDVSLIRKVDTKRVFLDRFKGFRN